MSVRDLAKDNQLLADTVILKEEIKQRDAIIVELLRRLNYFKTESRNQIEIMYCSYECLEWEVLFKEEDPLKHLTACAGCWKITCENCAQKNNWRWKEELEGIENPPYYTEYFCPECQLIE